jgi:hypothetical protein
MENKGVWVLDIETTDLLANMLDYSSFPYKLKPEAKLWCVVLRNVYTEEIISAEGINITRDWLKVSLEGCTHLIGHNVIKFDFLTLKLFGVLDYNVGYLDQRDSVFGKDVKIIDTLILSRLFNPDRFGGHSLHSWGERVPNENLKMDFRQLCINKGYITKSSPKGQEFKNYCPEMLTYCLQDTSVNKDTFFALMGEMDGYKGWSQAIKVENKLADLAVRRETLGFWFDKDLAVKCVEDLTEKMEALQNKVNPILPPKPMTKGELNAFTAPNIQFIKNGRPSANLVKFAARIGGFIEEDTTEEESPVYAISFENKRYILPYTLPFKTHVEADISNLDHVKTTLIDVYGWEPTEWAERDLTKDSKKQALSLDKQEKALERWFKETMEGKYKVLRLAAAFEKFKVKKGGDLLEVIKSKLGSAFPVKVITSPKVRVGVEKELCPNLTKLGEKVEFAKDFALFLTYKHRKSSIAGGDIEDMDFDLEYPNTGFLSMYREEDGRVATPAIEIGASTNRYRHIGIANIARATSVYGKEMRSLFGSGEHGLQFGYDFASLEARIQGHYCWKYTGGEELAVSLLAEKPNDIHTLTGLRLGLPRGDAKSINYAILYGSSVNKIKNMLSCEIGRATEIYDGFWDSVLPLKELKAAVEKHWENNDKKFVIGIDGRKINIRSKHSILNALFQSAGVISAKYVNVISMQYLESLGHCIDPFIAQPSVCEMIAYHDECQLFVDKKNVSFKKFESKEQAVDFVASWTGSQLSAISEGNIWYVTLPNDISISIEKAITKTQELLKLSVPLGFEWIVNKNWYGCH